MMYSQRFGISAGILISGWLLGIGPLLGQSREPDKPLIGSIRGVDLYVSYCASCHGRDGKGAGPMVGLLKVPPADLTRIAIRNQGSFPLAKVQKIIQGTDQPGATGNSAGGHGSREMPVWGPIFSRVTVTPSGQDADLGRVRIDNLARYLREIQVAR